MEGPDKLAESLKPLQSTPYNPTNNALYFTNNSLFYSPKIEPENWFLFIKYRVILEGVLLRHRYGP
jgi:hypothetical protein